MSAEERTAELNRQIAEHERKSIEEEFGGTDKASLEHKLKAEELRGELGGIKNKKLDMGSLTANQRIGAYASMPIRDLNRVHEKNESHLAKIEQHLAQKSSIYSVAAPDWSRPGRGVKH